MKREIRFAKVDFEVTASIKKGKLIAELTAEIEPTPAEVARVLNFKRQNTALNLVIEAPQLALDLEFTEVREPEGEKAIEGLPLFLKTYNGWHTEGDKPVFKAKIDDVTGEGRSPREATLIAIVMGGVLSDEEMEEPADKIVETLRGRYAPHQADGLFPYLPNICEVITEDSFEIENIFEPRAASARPKRGRPKNKAPA